MINIEEIKELVFECLGQPEERNEHSERFLNEKLEKRLMVLEAIKVTRELCVKDIIKDIWDLYHPGRCVESSTYDQLLDEVSKLLE